MCGNRITSRIDGESVSSITRRSMPMPSAAGRRHAVLQRADVVGVEVHGFVVAGVLVGSTCGQEALGLVFRVVQLGEAVGDFAAADEQLEAVGDAFALSSLATRQRRHFDRVVGDEGRLFHSWCFDRLFENHQLQLAQAVEAQHLGAGHFFRRSARTSVGVVQLSSAV